jgi:hypothetical protein
MAFWMDPLLLVAAGILVAWTSKRVFDGSDLAVYGGECVVVAVTYAVAIGLFLNLSPLEPVWRALGAETGTAFMINGWVLDLVAVDTTWSELGPGAMGLAILLFALYPVFLRAGVVAGRLLLGRNRDQSGLWGLANP